VKRLLILPRAELDLDELAEYIARDNLDAALGLYTAADLAFQRLVEMPDIGAKREYLNPRLAHLRMWPLPHYPNVLVFYEALNDVLRIVRVFHGSRDIAGLFSE